MVWVILAAMQFLIALGVEQTIKRPKLHVDHMSSEHL